MFISLRDMPDGSRLKADICIVGAGPAGLALARALGGDGPSVILLEAGAREPAPESQALNAGEVSGPLHTGLTDGRCRSFGGTSRLWAGQCVPMEKLDLARRPWVPFSGWPIEPDELARFTRAAENFFDLGAPSYDDGIYRDFGLPPPAWRKDRLLTRFTIYAPRADLGRGMSRRFAAAPGLRVMTDACVTQLHLDGGGQRVASLNARSLCGRSCHVSARIFIICAGAVETARLLLASDAQRPAGLGNAHDLVGRFYQDHPNGIVADVNSSDPARLERLFRLLYRGRLRYFPKFALSPAVQRARGTLNANAHLVFRYEDDPGLAVMRELLQAGRRRSLSARHLLALPRLGASLGQVTRAASRRLLHGLSPTGRLRRIELQAYLEQAPDPRNCLRLSDRLDRLGQRQVALSWRFGEAEQATLRALVEMVEAEFSRLGLGEVIRRPVVDAPPEEWSGLIVDGFHPAGTARMGRHAREAVVDADLRVFDVPNLYLCGSAVFPTSGFANPTLTIVALSLRLAAHLKRALSAPATGIGPSCAPAPGMKELA